MAPNEDEEELLRSVALQNARSVLLARQRAEEALRQSEERYRALTRAITSVVWTTDAEGRFVTAQPSWSAYTGQTWEELRDFGWANALHPDDRERVRSLWEAARAARTLYQSDGRVWHAASRSYRHFEARAVPVLNSDGSVREWVGECLDVEDRKQAEAASALLAAIVATSDDAIITKNLDGVITSWNKSAERLFGYAEQEAVGRSVTMLIPPDRLNEEPQILDRLRCGERVDHFETIRVRKDGGTLDVSLTISPVKDAAGRIVGVSKIARDITERKRAEVALREADRHKNEFLATLAHELRNPLAPIRNALQIMRMTGRNGEAVTSASEMMERQVGQMVRLVDDLLDVSRISRGKIELRRGRIELASAVNHAVEAARALYKSMNHELTVALPAQPIYLNADPTRLAQVVGNLLNNACKFTDKGGRISLTVEREGTQAVIRVRDTGIGIAAEQLPRIFDMFVQVDTSLERSVSGLGIGLTLVKNLVEMHDGTIEVHSAGVGHGSEFVVRLPILVETADPPPEPTVGEPSPTTARRILVVDDNRDSATSLAMLLKLTGNETHTAYDGLEAVEAASAFKPDVVLLDIGLPRLNGYEACRRIREQPWGKGIMLVALTGWGQEEDRQKSREAGFNAHMVKPVELDALMKLLASLSPKEERQLTKR